MWVRYRLWEFEKNFYIIIYMREVNTMNAISISSYIGSYNSSVEFLVSVELLT